MDKTLTGLLYFGDVLLKTIKMSRHMPEYRIRVTKYNSRIFIPDENDKMSLVTMVFDFETMVSNYTAIYRFSGVEC